MQNRRHRAFIKRMKILSRLCYNIDSRNIINAITFDNMSMYPSVYLDFFIAHLHDIFYYYRVERTGRGNTLAF